MGRLDNLILTYDACPRVVQYGVDSAVSFLRLHEDVPRAVPVSAPAQQGSTLYGRCSVEPSAGATFQSVTLSALNVIQQSTGGPIDLGNKLGESYLLMLSALSQNSPTNPVWDFNLEMDPSVFLLANTYYLEATLDLTFANTGPLTRKLRMPLLARASGAKLRSTLSNPHAVALAALSERADNDSETQEGIFSNTFEMRAADAEAEATDGALLREQQQHGHDCRNRRRSGRTRGCLCLYRGRCRLQETTRLARAIRIGRSSPKRPCLQRFGSVKNVHTALRKE